MFSLLLAEFEFTMHLENYTIQYKTIRVQSKLAMKQLLRGYLQKNYTDRADKYKGAKDNSISETAAFIVFILLIKL